MPLLALDPLKYPVTPTSTLILAGTSGNLVNNGTFPSSRIQVTADEDGIVSLKNMQSGGIFRANGTEDGTIFDFRRRTAYSGGENRYSDLASTSVWWDLAPGTTEVQNNGTADVSTIYYPAFI